MAMLWTIFLHPGNGQPTSSLYAVLVSFEDVTATLQTSCAGTVVRGELLLLLRLGLLLRGLLLLNLLLLLLRSLLFLLPAIAA